MTISTLHSNNIHIYFSKISSLDFIPLLTSFLILSRTISLNWIPKNLFNDFIHFFANNHPLTQ